MSNTMQWARQEDTPKVWLSADREYSYRLITGDRHGAPLSFHLTTYLPDIDSIVEGDGGHDTVLYCLSGWARHVDLLASREWEFRPGQAVYLPRTYRYRRIVGSAGMTVAVACTPSR